MIPDAPTAATTAQRRRRLGVVARATLGVATALVGDGTTTTRRPARAAPRPVAPVPVASPPLPPAEPVEPVEPEPSQPPAPSQSAEPPAGGGQQPQVPTGAGS